MGSQGTFERDCLVAEAAVIRNGLMPSGSSDVGVPSGKTERNTDPAFLYGWVVAQRKRTSAYIVRRRAMTPPTAASTAPSSNGLSICASNPADWVRR